MAVNLETFRHNTRAKDELLQRCWANQDCSTCLHEGPCSWCPTVCEFSIKLTAFDSDRSRSRRLAFPIPLKYRSLHQYPMKTYAPCGQNDGNSELVDWVVTCPLLPC